MESIEARLTDIGTSILASLTKLDSLNSTCSTISVQSATSSTCTMLSPLVITTGSQVIAQANPNRKGFIIFNNSSNSTYVTLGPTSVAARCTRLVATFASWEWLSPCVYTGVISAIRNAGTGEVVVFELT